MSPADRLLGRLSRTAHPRLAVVVVLGAAVGVVGTAIAVAGTARGSATATAGVRLAIAGYLLFLLGASGYVAFAVFERAPD